MNRTPEVAGMVSLGEGRRHKLDQVILDLDVVANALEEEELGKSSGGSNSYDETTFLTCWARLRGRDQCIKRSGAGSQTDGTLWVGGLLVKIPFIRRVMRE
jgi:hypothetical protein